MKSDSDNFREAVIIDIIKFLRAKDVNVIIYEPLLKEDKILEFPVVSLAKLKQSADLIVANRYSSELYDVKDKVYTRDIFGEG